MILGICPGPARSQFRASTRVPRLLSLFLLVLTLLPVSLTLTAQAVQAQNPSPSGNEKPPKKPKASPSATPTIQVKKPLTPEEIEKQEWIRHWCKRAKKDPKCRFYAEKQLGQAMRDANKAERAMGVEEYCNLNRDDIQCQARRDRLDQEEQRRKQKELMAYCRENPDAQRCEEAFGLTDVPDSDPVKEGKVGSKKR